MNPWICPKCNRVYAPFVWECKNCNQKLMKRQAQQAQQDQYYQIVEKLDGGARIRFNGGQP